MELFQITHFLFLVGLSLSTRRKSVAVRAAVTLYIFYSIAPAVSFSIEYFSLRINHQPQSNQLLAMLVADIMLLMGCGFAGGNRPELQSVSDDSPAFARGVAVTAIIAVALDALANHETLLELKGASSSVQSAPNLLVLSFPAGLVLLGTFWRMPFSGWTMRSIIFLSTLFAIAVSVLQGYRDLVLFAVLMWFFHNQRAIGPLLVALILTGFGELSEGAKVLVRSAITSGDSDVIGYLTFFFDSLSSRVWLTREQMAIASNWDIAELSQTSMSVQDEFLILIPGLRSITGVTLAESGADQISLQAGVGDGEGTAFGYGIFLLLHPVLACLGLALLPSLVNTVRSSILLPLALSFTFSFLRDTPEHWIGQLKLLALLLFLRSLMTWRKTRSPCLRPSGSLRVIDP
jgi:hypothetical protein